MSRGVGHTLGLDPVLLWLWCQPGATAPIRPLAWDLPYAGGCGPIKKKKKKDIFSAKILRCVSSISKDSS